MGRQPLAARDDAGREPGDLQRHADDFRNRTGFTYTVLDPANRDVIGCVYIYPLPDSDDDARALSWVRASHAALDVPLWRAVSDWLASTGRSAASSTRRARRRGAPAGHYEFAMPDGVKAVRLSSASLMVQKRMLWACCC